MAIERETDLIRAPKQQIQGLRFLVSGDEMVQHLSTKRDEHKRKADQYDAQVASLPREAGPPQTNDPRMSLAQSAATHRRKEKLFDFMATHLAADATYDVNEADLQRVEWLDRW